MKSKQSEGFRVSQSKNTFAARTAEVRCNFRTDGEMGENVKVGGSEGAVAPDKVGEGTRE